MLERLQVELTADNDARAAVRNIPPAVLSVSHALLLWDSRWTEPAAVGGSAVLEPIRRVILTELARTAAQCLRQPISGPRLLILDWPEGQTLLAVGSGVWSWGALLDLTADAPPTG